MPSEEPAGKPIRIAVVGAGWAATRRHLPAMRATGCYELVGAIDVDETRAKDAARAFAMRHFALARLPREVPWIGEVDAVSVGAPAPAHHAVIKDALLLGKHVITEKPFTLRLEEGEEIVALARERDLRLGIVHNFQFSHSAGRLIADLGHGRLGRIRSIHAWQLSNPERRLPPWHDELPLGLFYDESPHFLYLLNRLAPGPLELLDCSMFQSPEGRTTPARVDIRYRCNADGGIPFPISVSMDFEAPLSEWHLTVCGERALVDIDIFRDIYIRLPNDGTHGSAAVFRTSFLAGWQHWAQHLTRGVAHLFGSLRYGNDEIFRRFAKAVRSGEEPESIGPTEALRILAMQHEVIGRLR